MKDNESKIEYYLGIDWGRNKIGLALADSETRIASGLFEKKSGEEFWSELAALREKFSLEKLVLGRPESKKFESNLKDIESFKMELEKRGFSVETVNEAFSSKLAQGNLKDAGKKIRKTGDNMEAARIILQDWLDRE